MKTIRSGVVLCLMILLMTPLSVSGEKWWILGTVQGSRVRDNVISVKLVRQGYSADNYTSVTSTNKFGQYAFSNPGEGLPPSAYSLFVYVGNTPVTTVSLSGVRPGGRVPPIAISW